MRKVVGKGHASYEVACRGTTPIKSGVEGSRRKILDSIELIERNRDRWVRWKNITL